MTTPQRNARSPITQYSIWLNLVNRLLNVNCLFNIEDEGNKCLIPVPWKSNDKLSIPYGRADIPFLKKLLLSSNSLKICKSLQALVERAYNCHKAMDMLRLDVLSPLNRLTRHAEPFVRQRCCVLIRVLAGQPLGKVLAVRNAALVRNMLSLMADPEYAVRFHCAVAVMAQAEHRPGNEAMVELGCTVHTLQRLRAEQDKRVVPALLHIVGRLTATVGGGSESLAAADLTAALAGELQVRSWNGAEAGALLDCGCGEAWAGRGLFEYLKHGARSSDYRTAVDSVACLSRGAAILREANEYLASDRDTVDLLVSFASSSHLRGRALRAFSAQLLCAMARTTAGLANLKDAMAVIDWSPDKDEGKTSSDPVTARYLTKLARVVRSVSYELSDENCAMVN